MAAAKAASATQGLHNWNHTHSTTPAVLLHPTSVQDVQAAVRDPANPTPLLAVGSMHSVTECLINDGGTIINVSALNAVLGLHASQRSVRVQAGATLADIHDWLGDKGLELSFSPEIGDATVGSLAVATSKDSSVGGPGFLSALVLAVTYVNEEGELVTLERDGPQHAAFMDFSCSYGGLGIVLEVELAVRPQVLVETCLGGVPLRSAQQLAHDLLALRAEHANVFAIIVPSSACVVVETRDVAPPDALARMGRARRSLNGVVERFIQRIKFNGFQVGSVPNRLNAWLLRAGRLRTLHYRRSFVNRYPPASPKRPRLDFSFVEFDCNPDQMHAILDGALTLAKDFEERTGFMPSGFAVYFCDRPGDKPAGAFSGPPGMSITLDPITGAASEPRWHSFCAEYAAWARSQGARVSLSQTKSLAPGPLLPARLLRPRFRTAFVASFAAAAAYKRASAEAVSSHDGTASHTDGTAATPATSVTSATA